MIVGGREAWMGKRRWADPKPIIMMGIMSRAPHVFGQQIISMWNGLANPFGNLFLLILMFVIFYFLLIRPQQKKVKQHKEMIASLRKGDKVVTAGGIHGTISNVSDNTVTVEIAPKVRIKVQKGSISYILSRGAQQQGSENQ